MIDRLILGQGVKGQWTLMIDGEKSKRPVSSSGWGIFLPTPRPMNSPFLQRMIEIVREKCTKLRKASLHMRNNARKARPKKSSRSCELALLTRVCHF
jgi:hypothetical protein